MTTLHYRPFLQNLTHTTLKGGSRGRTGSSVLWGKCLRVADDVARGTAPSMIWSPAWDPGGRLWLYAAKSGPVPRGLHRMTEVRGDLRTGCGDWTSRHRGRVLGIPRAPQPEHPDTGDPIRMHAISRKRQPASWLLPPIIPDLNQIRLWILTIARPSPRRRLMRAATERSYDKRFFRRPSAFRSSAPLPSWR